MATRERRRQQASIRAPKESEATFNPETSLLTSRMGKQKYSKGLGSIPRSFHWGQLKLLLGEVQFMVNHWDPGEYPEPTLVVAGGAPGEHYALLLEMFPQIKEIHLWDGRPFAKGLLDIRKIVLHQELMYPEQAKVYQNIDGVFFISDIRSCNPKSMGKVEAYEAVKADHSLQQELLIDIDPVASLLKFKPPYPDVPGISQTYRYLSGYVYTQCFPGAQSIETRLVPIKGDDGQWELFDYDINDYEQRMAYYNSSLRNDPSGEHITWRNSINGSTAIPDSHLKNSFDVAHMLYIIDMYLWFSSYDTENGDVRFRTSMIIWNWILASLEFQMGVSFDFKRGSSSTDCQIEATESRQPTARSLTSTTRSTRPLPSATRSTRPLPSATRSTRPLPSTTRSTRSLPQSTRSLPPGAVSGRQSQSREIGQPPIITRTPILRGVGVGRFES